MKILSEEHDFLFPLPSHHICRFGLKMIRSDKLVYGGQDSKMWNWESDSIAFNAIAIAILTTLLSQQASRVLFDLLMGLKPRLQTARSNMQIMLLIQRASIVAIISSLFRNFQKPSVDDLEKCPSAAQLAPKNINRTGVTARLLVLIMIPPTANVASLLLMLEREKTIYFHETNFGGVALGINEDLRTVRTESMTDACVVSPIETHRDEDPLAKFIICTQTTDDLETKAIDRHKGMLTIKLMSNFSIQGQVLANGKRTDFGIEASIATDGGVYAIQHGFSRNKVNIFFNYGFRLLARECGVSDLNQAIDNTEEQRKLSSGMPYIHVLLSKYFDCSQLRNYSIAQKISNAMVSIVTLTSTSVLRVTEYCAVMNGTHKFANPTFFEGGSLPILRRKRRNSSLVFIFIILLGVISIRILTTVACNNDINLGLELAMKKALGLSWDASLLQDSSTIIIYKEEEQGDTEPT